MTDPENMDAAHAVAIAKLQADILDGLNSGPAEPLDMEQLIVEAHTRYRDKVAVNDSEVDPLKPLDPVWNLMTENLMGSE